MDSKTALLSLIKNARARAEAGDLGIADQHEVISQLEAAGLPSDKAREVLAMLVSAQEVDLAEMERLLDLMEGR